MDLSERNGRIIDAVVGKARKCCPGALAMVGVNGSFMTGDCHEKSDLDLLILINDERGQVLAETFIQDDLGVGHDLYCQTWEQLESIAEYNSPHLSKLLHAEIVYCADDAYAKRLESIREKVRSMLAAPYSYEDYLRAERVLLDAYKYFTDALTADDIAHVRYGAGNTIWCIEDALMLLNKTYYRLGMRRTLDELNALNVRPRELNTLIMNTVLAETAEDVKQCLCKLMTETRKTFAETKKRYAPERKAPSAENIRGTYEEMYSNWRNKILLSAENGDTYTEFMSLVCADGMAEDIGEEVDIGKYCFTAGFDPENLTAAARHYIAETDKYLTEYARAGIEVKRYADIDAFAREYTNRTGECNVTESETC